MGQNVQIGHQAFTPDVLTNGKQKAGPQDTESSDEQNYNVYNIGARR